MTANSRTAGATGDRASKNSRAAAKASIETTEDNPTVEVMTQASAADAARNGRNKSAAASSAAVGRAAHGNPLGFAAPGCFVHGARIRTPQGDVPVEDLQVGQVVLTEFTGTQSVRWIGHRSIVCDRHPMPGRTWPVRIRAGAFAPKRPYRDLLVSPQHALYVEDVLVPARYLINGLNVVQHPVAVVDYYHIELATHDIVLANGMPAESYLETDQGLAFQNHDGVTALHPDMSACTWDSRTCADVMIMGREVEAIRAILLIRAMRSARLSEQRSSKIVPWTAAMAMAL